MSPKWKSGRGTPWDIQKKGKREMEKGGRESWAPGCTTQTLLKQEAVQLKKKEKKRKGKALREIRKLLSWIPNPTGFFSSSLKESKAPFQRL